MPPLRFGVFELDPETGELRRSGLRVRLQPQAAQVLRALLERPGEVVSRDDLRRRLWGDDTFVAFDRSLNFCVNRLRSALDDDARHPRFIETLPGRGYRFIGPVTPPRTSPRTSPGAPPSPRPATAASGSRRRRQLAVVSCLFTLTLFTLFPPAGRQHAPQRDAEAQALYAKARGLCGPAGWRESIRLYAAALDREPGFAAAQAGIAQSYWALGEGGSLDPDQAFPAAKDAARRALALEDRSDARLILGQARLVYDWDWPGAEGDLRRSLALDPSAVRAWMALARYLSARGDHDEALRAAKRAETLDPGHAEAVEEVAWCLYRARRLDEAARRFQLVAERRPEEAHHRLFVLYRVAGRDEEAMKEACAVMRLAGVPAETLERLARGGTHPALRGYLRGSISYLNREASRYRVPPERFALLHAALGDHGQAIAWLLRAADQRSPTLLTALVDPELDPLRPEPRFVSLARRVGARAALGS